MCKILKNSYSESRVVRMHHFWAQNGPFAPNCFLKIINIILIYLLASFIVQNFKNSSSGSRVMMMHNFWAQNGQFAQMSIFFRKPVNEPCFFHWCLSTCQKSKSDINLLVKYWQLKNTEISLAKRLRRMLINHKNFHFTQIPDKTSDIIFLKSPKTLFLDHF